MSSPSISMPVALIEQARVMQPKILVIGVGGGGCNAVNNMIVQHSGDTSAFVVANTDAQVLHESKCEQRIQLGIRETEGLGAGGDPEVGRKAAEESQDEIIDALEGHHMVIVITSAGGGTGSGAAPIIARLAHERGLLTVGVVNKAFIYEGTKREQIANVAIEQMQHHTDTLLVIPNDNLAKAGSEDSLLSDSLAIADRFVSSTVSAIINMMTKPGLLNLDFADLRTVMRDKGKAVMGSGDAKGENRALEASEKALSNPLLDDVSMKGAKHVLILMISDGSLTSGEHRDVCQRIRGEIDEEAYIADGTSEDPDMGEILRVLVIATGVDGENGSVLSPPAGPAPQRSATTVEAGGGSNVVRLHESTLRTASPANDKNAETPPSGIGSPLSDVYDDGSEAEGGMFRRFGRWMLGRKNNRRPSRPVPPAPAYDANAYGAPPADEQSVEIKEEGQQLEIPAFLSKR